jgi:hypothetical protein
LKEQAQATKICRYLDEGAEQLSYRVAQRLAAARAAAVAKVAEDPQPGADPSPTRMPPTHVPLSQHQPGAPLWWRVAVTLVPVLLLVVGVVVVDTVHEEQSAAELAEVDSALLTDDVPLVAYADRGFGVYIKNTRR